MPRVSEDGAITVGSKRTTVYVVDAMTGKPLLVYRSPDSPSKLESYTEGAPLSHNGNGNKELSKSAASSTAQRRFHITRTDCTLQSFHPNSDKVSWSLMVSKIGAALPGSIVIREHDTTEYISTSHHDDPKLPLPAPNDHKSVVNLDSTSDDHHNRKMLLVADPESASVATQIDVHDLRAPHTDGKAIFAKYPVILAFISFFIIVVAFVINHILLAKKFAALKDQLVANRNTGPSKRKKSRRSGKSNNSIEDGFSRDGGDNKTLLDLNKVVGCLDGRRIGKLIVSSTEIAKGSNGTIVLEGFYEGRAVAVKRLIQAHHDVAFKEMQNLIASDHHQDIVRWYGVEYDQDFVYLALERCTCSVDDLIQIYSDTSRNPVLRKDPATCAMIEHNIHLDLVKGVMQDLNLWKANGHPSPLFLKLMRLVWATANC
ncbi:Glutamate receptor 3.6 [Hibiscus syriacus]|uniref:non-specific serine/threonine protein kinase n=1 Tax=Hibiscus syriacus TaxID=106335 RepID=A0A6A3BU44_HIBSY|nr:Glutamate receptor 3.6 [Hibiscus syriacus]